MAALMVVRLVFGYVCVQFVVLVGCSVDWMGLSLDMTVVGLAV
jgi:hypothetical protein